MFDTPRDVDPLSASPIQGRRDATLLEPLLRDAGLPADLADALDDAAFDDEIRAETEEALALTGRDVGTPILHFQPPGGTAFFGPVISRLPVGRRRGSRCGTTSSRWRPFPASPRSSAACGSGPSWPASASTPNRLARKRTGTAAAVALKK